MTPARGIATAEVLGIGLPLIVIAALAFLYVKGVKRSLTISSVIVGSTQASMIVTNTSSSIVQFYPGIIFDVLGLRYQGNVSSIGANGSDTFTISYPAVPSGSSYLAYCNSPSNQGISNTITGNSS